MHIKYTNLFISSIIHKKLNLPQIKQRNYHYLLESTRCFKKYIVKSELFFSFRSSVNHNKLLSGEQDFRQTDHKFKRNPQFIIIELILKKSNNITSLLKTCIDRWILHREIQKPKELN